MKKHNPEDYYDFFLELPQPDYLNDIEIQDEYEKTSDNSSRGLSDEQVSQIARDSLNLTSAVRPAASGAFFDIDSSVFVRYIHS
jgi:hypothetical protein